MTLCLIPNAPSTTGLVWRFLDALQNEDCARRFLETHSGCESAILQALQCPVPFPRAHDLRPVPRLLTLRHSAQRTFLTLLLTRAGGFPATELQALLQECAAHASDWDASDARRGNDPDANTSSPAPSGPPRSPSRAHAPCPAAAPSADPHCMHLLAVLGAPPAPYAEGLGRMVQRVYAVGEGRPARPRLQRLPGDGQDPLPRPRRRAVSGEGTAAKRLKRTPRAALSPRPSPSPSAAPSGRGPGTATPDAQRRGDVSDAPSPVLAPAHGPDSPGGPAPAMPDAPPALSPPPAPPPDLPAGLRRLLLDVGPRLRDGGVLDLDPLREAVDAATASAAVVQEVLEALSTPEHGIPDELLVALGDWLMPPAATGTALLTHDGSAQAFLSGAVWPRVRALATSASRPLVALLEAAAGHYNRLFVESVLVPLLCRCAMGAAHAELVGRLAKSALDPATAAQALQRAWPATDRPVWTEHTVQALHALVGALAGHAGALPEEQVAAATRQLLVGMEAHAARFAGHLRFGALLFAVVSKLGPAVASERQMLQSVASAHTTFMKQKVLAAIQNL